jgi:hypothetical protein
MSRIFTYEEALAMLPEVQRLTSVAVGEIETVSADAPPAEYQTIISRWHDAVRDLGIEVKGLWLIDFDNGSGYYCWQHPETSLQYFHGYEEGFTGRVKLN